MLTSRNRPSSIKRSQPTLLRGMLSNNPHTSMAAATGALSSATARGYLPQYGGSAAASLGPSMTNTAVSSPSYKQVGKVYATDSVASALNENRPPTSSSTFKDGARAKDLLQSLHRQDEDTQDSGYGSNASHNQLKYGDSTW
jgi:hypothetical protein